jgi:hypothetical protein
MYDRALTFCAENNLTAHLPVESTPSSANETVTKIQRSTKRAAKTSPSMKDFVVTSTLGQRDEPIPIAAISSASSTTSAIASSSMNS